MELTLLKQEFKISDLIGNIINSPVINYKITVEDKKIKGIFNLHFSNLLSKLPVKQAHISNHLNNGAAFRYKVFKKDIHSVPEITYHQIIDDTWKTIKDLDIIKLKNNYYIGVVEVDFLNRALRYSYMKS